METVPDTTWKAVIEMSLDMPFNQLKKIDHETMVSTGLEGDILRLDEQAVSIYCTFQHTTRITLFSKRFTLIFSFHKK